MNKIPRSVALPLLSAVEQVCSDESATFSDACDLYIDRGHVGDTDVLYLERLREEIGGMPLVSLTRRFIDEAITQNRLRVRGLTSGTVRRELGTLQAVLNHAVDMELTTHVVRVRKPSDSPGRTEWLSMSDVNRFIVACDPEFKAFAVALFLTGMRLGEAINAQWEDVRGNVLLVKSRKGRGGREKTRSIPLAKRLTDMIGTQGSGWLLKRRCGSQWTKRMVYVYWNGARDALGIGRALTPHCARHSFASNLIMSGVDGRTVAELLGHSSMDMMKRYTHLNTTHLTEAVAKLTEDR